MKRIKYLIFFLSFVSAQAQVKENFSDNDFLTNPTWSGTSQEWRVVNGVLNTSNTKAGKSYLVTRSNLALDTQWEFWVNLQFNPSGSNYVDVFLMADTTDLLSAQGYFVRIGSSKDDVCLYKKQNGKNTLLIDGKDQVLNKSNNLLRIKVIRDQEAVFSLWGDYTGTGNEYQKEGSMADNGIVRSSYFGFLAVYTGSVSFLNKHFFDDIDVGRVFRDTVPPFITAIKPLSANTVQIWFSEKLNHSSATDAVNYYVPGIGFPEKALLDSISSKAVTLIFKKTFTNRITYQLEVKGIQDEAFNVIERVGRSFTYYVPSSEDIVINELMADPTPVVGLPEEEYIELYNRMTFAVDLTGWKLKKGNSNYTITDVSIPAQSYLILCRFIAEDQLKKYGLTKGMASFPSLTNTGDQIALLDPTGQQINIATYTDAFYGSTAKKEGGWSLEKVNPDKRCDAPGNWKASVNRQGGSPGSQNSVYDISPDQKPPALIKYWPIGDSALMMRFDEPVEIRDDILFSSTLSRKRMTVDMAGNDQVLVVFNEKISKGELMKLSVSGIQDCEGNRSFIELNWVLPEESGLEDIVINEVLFNPKTGGVDFVELYNRSGKYIDISTWAIANIKDEVVASKVKVDKETKVMNPYSYLALTENPERILQDYPFANKEALLKVSSMPSYNDDKGSVVLCTPDGQIAERFDYSEDFHFKLVDNKDGVSLERIDTESSVNRRDNWHSASADAGYATPGYKNSQSANTPVGDDILVEPQVFSPNEDGRDDFTLISYRYSNRGNVQSVHVYDAHGRLVRTLSQNTLAGVSGFIQWDGITEQGQKAKLGPYILHIEAYDLDGITKTYRKRVIVAF